MPRHQRLRRRRRIAMSWVAGGVGAAVVAVALALQPGASVTTAPADGTFTGASIPAAGAAARRELRATLDPARFTGTAQRAYQVAREIPDVLDRLQCYCACRSEYGHVSLLSCYADGHGST